jgi:hypothetical protein
MKDLQPAAIRAHFLEGYLDSRDSFGRKIKYDVLSPLKKIQLPIFEELDNFNLTKFI